MMKILIHIVSLLLHKLALFLLDLPVLLGLIICSRIMVFHMNMMSRDRYW